VSPELRKVLGEIFCMYSNGEDSKGPTTITSTMASRLWYRCGMKLASLETILQAKDGSDDDVKRPSVALEDFLGVIEQVVEEDEAKLGGIEQLPSAAAVSACEIGDKVELVEGYERYGDATSGPLQIGDRGVVVEQQRGPNGEKYVLHFILRVC
jgi:hypothetical protein